jgi:hypothetical protein
MRKSIMNLFSKPLTTEQAKAGTAEPRLDAVKRLKAVCRERVEAAAQIDKAYADLAMAVERLGRADNVIYELRRFASSNAISGHNFGLLRIDALVKLAEANARIPGVISLESSDEISTAVAAVERDNATILDGIEP